MNKQKEKIIKEFDKQKFLDVIYLNIEAGEAEDLHIEIRKFLSESFDSIREETIKEAILIFQQELLNFINNLKTKNEY